MFIKRLEIYGFKSFPYKVSIPFSPGITAIVGPNGSGKSNILDAIRWVLGEQSPKKLRIKELSDLIFSGNTDKKFDFAEVKLILNHEPILWEKYKDFPEIVIMRRFYKDGESEFFINQKPCRLKDIHFLFLDLGVNSQGYGIIEQGEVSRFIELSPKERRIFLEDLAGISRLKITEEEVRKNLQKTEENLIRVNDIINEVKIQYEHLKKQVEEAKFYLNLKNKLQKLLIKKNLYLLNINYKEKENIEKKIKDLLSKKETLENELENLESEEHKFYQELLLLDRKIKDLKEEIQSKEKYYKDGKEKLESLIKQERELLYKLEKEKLKEENEKEKLKSLSQELLFIENTLKEFKKKKEIFNKKLEELKKEKRAHYKIFDEKIKNFQNFEKEYLTLEKDKERLNEKIELLEKEFNHLKKEKNITEKIFQDISVNLERIEKEKEIQNFLIKEKEKKSKSLIKEQIEIEKKSEEISKKLEALNKEKIKSLAQIQSLKDRLNLVEKILSKNNLSSASLVFSELNLPPLEAYLNLNAEDLFFLELIFKDNLNALIIEDLNIIKRLISKSFKENVVLVWGKSEIIEKFSIEKHDSISDKILESYKNNLRFIYFIKEKILLTPYGFIYLIRKKEKGLFSLRRERKELLKSIKSSEKNLETILEKEKGLKDEIKKLEKNLNELEKNIKNVNKDIENLNIQKEKMEISYIKFEERKKSLDEKIKDLKIKIKNLEDEKEHLIKELKNINILINERKKEYNLIKKEKITLETKLNEFNKKIHSLEQEIIKIQTQEEDLRNRKILIQKEIKKIKTSLKKYKFDKELLINDADYIKNKVKEFNKKIKDLNIEISELNKNLENLLINKNEKEKTLKTLENKKRKIEKKLKELDTEKHNLELKLLEKDLVLDSIKKEFKDLEFEKYKIEFEKKDINNINFKEIEKDIQETKELLDKFKEVNLASIKEFEIISQRYNQLIKHKADLESSIKEFKKILENIKKISEEKILKTLEEVNKKLDEIFPIIFKGGKAKLAFSDNDPLSSGLELKVSVPHKGIKHINMFSGGEKALCILAILISFYLIKPGPFCILDEVDAFLDEKNSLKFIKLLHLIKKNSQIILITHNPHIMKEVDTLLGVTMENKGISKIFILKKRTFLNECINH